MVRFSTGTQIFLCRASVVTGSIFACCAAGALQDSLAATGAGGCELCDKFILTESCRFAGTRIQNAAKIQPTDSALLLLVLGSQLVLFLL